MRRGRRGGDAERFGRGYADYVLFGVDCRPLAVIEAKSTSRSATEGRHQAALYADCLERRYGVRPVIYCTNGYRTEVVDGLGYPARTVYGYHTAGELELLIQRRGRSAITNLAVNDAITNREYQKRAVRKVCERFNGNFRRMLLAMATGTGKTRVAISLTDVLIRNNRVKNVLFLADRTALVKQAANSFKKLLPAATTCILSEDDKPDMTARVMFSTYQTMINYIDGDTKEFSIGRFDLIIVDEAHRSVFGKYTSILDYFDALLVGLTATPRDDMDRSTFDLFGVDAAQTFFYEYGEAVKDGYLVPYKPLKCGTLILQSGIVYDRLSDEEKEQMESVWRYEKARKALDEKEDYSRDIDNAEIFRYIFNKDTVDKVLQHTMQFGLRVQSGECIGKTIIFACNHRHAEMIVERFNALYPEYGADFCALVDNYVKCAQDLIDKFGFRDKLPQIAVSVDMLDTGIDVPDVLNLVFFKPVRSKIKFMQMIGRGTRLSEDIFGRREAQGAFHDFRLVRQFRIFRHQLRRSGERSRAVAHGASVRRAARHRRRVAATGIRAGRFRRIAPRPHQDGTARAGGGVERCAYRCQGETGDCGQVPPNGELVVCLAGRCRRTERGGRSAAGKACGRPRWRRNSICRC